ncbi:hypothetical protein AKJ51_05220 [candidate division MSBL1 archaeon SCGC-AAA382A20]|uniref:TATA-box-binding protein n=1 Tax=candidate division MSBL1 archaeon SCGC-AAA382A20 TaxID=1698280 RepID=A0A133VFP3_9EURY|nr:hypothetical protein AKJ51_05220 [candidate division MSBL1 archaeon SCGC-AAA382A20]
MENVEYEVNNIVLTVSYKEVELDLEKVASSLEGARYDPEVFPGVAYKMSEPKASFLLFATGNANCVGAKTVEDAEKSIEKLTEQLQDLGFEAGEPEVKVQNMVASVNFQRRFDLEEIARNFRHAEYNPEVFPGLVFRMEDTNVALLLFVQGEGVCVGAKNEEEIREGIKRLTEAIKK